MLSFKYVWGKNDASDSLTKAFNLFIVFFISKNGSYSFKLLYSNFSESEQNVIFICFAYLKSSFITLNSWGVNPLNSSIHISEFFISEEFFIFSESRSRVSSVEIYSFFK